MYQRHLRQRLNDKFADMDFFFQPANITSQIINFGLPAPIDLQVRSRDADRNFLIAQNLASEIRKMPGVGEVYVPQDMNYPGMR